MGCRTCISRCKTYRTRRVLLSKLDRSRVVIMAGMLSTSSSKPSMGPFKIHTSVQYSTPNKLFTAELFPTRPTQTWRDIHVDLGAAGNAFRSMQSVRRVVTALGKLTNSTTIQPIKEGTRLLSSKRNNLHCCQS